MLKNRLYWAQYLAVGSSLLTLLGGAIVYWILMTNFLYNVLHLDTNIRDYPRLHLDTNIRDYPRLHLDTNIRDYPRLHLDTNIRDYP
jgi:hypothetical protein